MKTFFGWCSILSGVISLILYFLEGTPIHATYCIAWAIYLLILAKEWEG